MKHVSLPHSAFGLLPSLSFLMIVARQLGFQFVATRLKAIGDVLEKEQAKDDVLVLGGINLQKLALGLGLRGSLWSSPLMVASEQINSTEFQYREQVDMLGVFSCDVTLCDGLRFPESQT